MKFMKKAFSLLLFLLTVGVALAVYVYLMAPTITAGDSSEMITAAITLGIPHQASYPVNTILGHLFTKLPWGSPAWRVNLMSGVFHALTAGVMYWVVINVIRVIRGIRGIGLAESLIALGASLFLAFTHTFWINSLKSEVFPLNNLLASLLILLSLLYFLMPNALYLIALTLVIGLGFAHHQTIIMVAPACFYLIYLKEKDLVNGLAVRFLKFILPDELSTKFTQINFNQKKLWLVLLSILAVIIGLSSYFSLMWLARGGPEMNWGDPSNLSNLWRSFMRADAGGFGAPAIYDTAPEFLPINQVKFYLHSWLKDFTYWGVILSLLGLLGLWKKNKFLFFFVVIGIVVSGPLFLVYANFPLTGSFAQATIIRFNLLSELFWTICIGVGLFWAWEKVRQLTSNTKEASNRVARVLVALGLGLVFLVPLSAHLKAVDQRDNTFSLEIGETMLAQTEDNAIILISGDIPNFVLDYLRFAEGKGGNRIIFSPGQMHMDWFVKQLKERYPDLEVPPPYSGYRFTVTHQLIDSNWDLGRPIYIMPELTNLDPVVGESYLTWPKGLLFRVYKPEEKEEINADEFIMAADRLWESIKPSRLGWLLQYQPNLDNPIFAYYSRHFYNLGVRLEELERYEDAIKQYERTLEIDSNFAQAHKALGVIYGYKLENKVVEKAVEHLERYYYLAPSAQEAQAAQSAIYELVNPPEATESAQLVGEEATESAEATSSAEAEEVN